MYGKHGQILDGIFGSIEQIGQRLIGCLCNKGLDRNELATNINELFQLNHGLLVSVGVGHTVINQVQNICNEYGFDHGFKITGGWGRLCLCKY